MRIVLAGIEAEYGRYRKLGSETLRQLDVDQIRHRPSGDSNSIATIVWHVSGNLQSRFTDFLTSDGEKPWRNREDEFAVRDATLEEVTERWDRGWAVLGDALAQLDDDDLASTVTVRGVELSVAQALLRSLGHTAYHVGQMTYLGKMLAGPDWTYLSIAPGGTAEYNRNPTHERG